MLPLHRKEKLSDASQHSFPYRFVKPAMFSTPRRQYQLRRIHILGFLISSLIFWVLFHGRDREENHKSPYAASSHYIGIQDVRPIIDVTIQECTKWKWFEKWSQCTALLNDGWEVSGGDLMLRKEKQWVHLFLKRAAAGQRAPVITDVRISRDHPNDGRKWEARPAGIWISHNVVRNIQDAVTAIDFIHGKDVTELRRGRHFVPGGYLHLGEAINLSIRIGHSPPREIPPLKAFSEQSYKILQVADLHLSTTGRECRDVVFPAQRLACEADAASLRFLEEILDSEKPDFVAFTGDQVDGSHAPNTKSAMFKFASTCIDRNIPYAVIFGNHDDEGDMTRQELMDVLTELPYCVSKPGLRDVDGVGNFVVAIEKPESRPPHAYVLNVSTRDIAIALWFLDTHKYSPNEKKYPGYDWLKPSQIEWFKWQHDQLSPWPNDTLHAAFIHIPLPEIRTVTNPVIGEWREGPTAPVFNSGFRTALADKNVTVLTAGHDHVNDYCMLDEMNRNREEKIWMCYGGGCGYGGYGGYGGYKRRLRVFEFFLSLGRIDTWKRVDEETWDSEIRNTKVDWQTLVENGIVSTLSLDVPIEGTNTTLRDYYESIKPPDITDIA